CLSDVLSEHGRSVWICGSMNIRYDQPINGLILPDPWETKVAPSDPSLKPYIKFVQQNVLEYTNESVPLSTTDYARFVSFMATHGLSVGTVYAVVKQLLAERRGHDRWKRAVLLDKLQFDVFAHFYRKLNPHFSSFFINSTAHFQHLYWRNMEPDLFLKRPTAAEQAEYETAIRFGSERAAARAMERLALLRVEGTAAMFVEQRGASLYAACSFNKPLPKDAILTVAEGGPTAPFFDHFYQVDGMKSGMHHPEGM